MAYTPKASALRARIHKEHVKEYANLEAERMCQELRQLRAELGKYKKISRKAIEQGLEKLNKTQIAIIKDGIEQFGTFGGCGRSFIATAILKALKELE
jgi:hypothetical protein